MTSIAEEIRLEKEKQNAVILAHLYVDGEVQDIADYCGDSYYLSQMAQKTDAEKIIFCGVEFMAESAKILNPEKTVLMADRSADCPMAHMATPDQVREYRDRYDDLAVVCYINSTTEIKAVSDVCVTSSNAKTVISNIPNKHILFIPDQNLGGYLAPLFPEKRFHFVDGYCHVHNFMELMEIEQPAEMNGKTFKLWRAVVPGKQTDTPAGTVVAAGSEGLDISAGGDVLRVTELQAPGKNRMKSEDYLRGNSIEIGTVLR